MTESEALDLAAFIAEHAHPYDAATDAYRRAPFALPVKAGKNMAIYNAHSYHTKVPPQGFVPYIEHYTEPGNLDRRPSDWELSEWLRFCYCREAYAEAVVLFPHIHPDPVEPERYKELKKIVAVCRMKTRS
jgi:hypothetical protein